MSQTPPGRMSALKDDGFVDFYELLGVEPDATGTRIRTTINTLHNEAQSNRDHRNLNRRREYQTLLHLLPQAREVLLEEKKRERYDAFREDVQRGVASVSFEDWMRNLKEEEDSTKSESSAVLGVQDEEREVGQHVATAKVKRVPPPRPSRVTVEESAPSTQPSRASLTGSIITVLVFFVLFVGLYFILNMETIALLIASVAAIVTWFLTHRKGSNRTAV